MADRTNITAANAILMSPVSLAAAFQLCGLLLTYLILEKHRLQLAGIHFANQYDIAVARLRDAPRRVCRRGRPWRKPGRTQQWWLNLYHGVLLESEWKKNFRMDREVFMRLQTSQVSRFCRETHGFQFNLTVSRQDRQISR